MKNLRTFKSYIDVKFRYKISLCNVRFMPENFRANVLLLRVLHGYKFLHPNPNRHSYTRTRTRPEYLYPDPTDTFKNMINFSNFYFIKNIKNIQRNSTFSSTSMGDESLSIFSILIIVKN
jgi:hypothetical protein